MPCRVGITRNPEKRKQDWKNLVVRLRNWRQKEIGSKSAAQRQEDIRFAACERAGLRGICHAHRGGRGTENFGWYVYDFDYDCVR